MMFAKVLVGLVAAAICVAGAGWYLVYIFAAAPSASARPTTRSDSLPRLQPAYRRRQARRAVLLGIAAVIGGLVLTPEALDSIRTGVPVHTLHGPDMNGWIVLAAIAFLIVLGAWIAASGLLTMRKASPDRRGTIDA
jgi:hypothetical protein